MFSAVGSSRNQEEVLVEGGGAESLTCVICYEKVVRLREAACFDCSCDYVYHWTCSSRLDRCPTCRSAEGAISVSEGLNALQMLLEAPVAEIGGTDVDGAAWLEELRAGMPGLSDMMVESMIGLFRLEHGLPPEEMVSIQRELTCSFCAKGFDRFSQVHSVLCESGAHPALHEECVLQWLSRNTPRPSDSRFEGGCCSAPPSRLAFRVKERLKGMRALGRRWAQASKQSTVPPREARPSRRRASPRLLFSGRLPV